MKKRPSVLISVSETFANHLQIYKTGQESTHPGQSLFFAFLVFVLVSLYKTLATYLLLVSSPFAYTGPPPPVVMEVLPSAGPVHGGTRIVILGSNFINSSNLKVRCFSAASGQQAGPGPP